MFGRRTPSAKPISVEQRSLQLPTHLITYTLKRSSKRRSVGLRIDERGLTVSVPARASESWVQTVLQQRVDWVADKLANWQAKKRDPQLWEDGGTLPFRGEQLTLRTVVSVFAGPPQLQGGDLIVYLGRSDDEQAAAKIQKQVTLWYRREALQVFQECVAYFAPLLAVTPTEIKLSNAQTQWGSCTSRGVVRLNWRLVQMPLHLIDYVVVHELAHLLEMNHSARFWSVVETGCPDYRQCRAELKGYGLVE